MTKQQIHTKINELKKELASLRDIAKDPRVLEANRIYLDLRERVWKEKRPRVEQLQAELNKLTEQYKTPIRKSSLFVPSERLQLWFKEYVSGIQEGRTWKIIWASPKELFIIVRMPGGMFWSSRSAVYGTAEYELIRVTAADRWHNRNAIMQHSGRLPKEIKSQMIARALEEENKI